MRSILFLFLSLSVSSFGFSDGSGRNGPGRPPLKIVLGLDSTVQSYESPFKFPCAETSGFVFCETSQVEFENATCARTFFVDRLAHKIELSCQIGLKKFVIATGNNQFRYKAVPGSRYGHIPLQLSEQVLLLRSGSKIQISFK